MPFLWVSSGWSLWLDWRTFHCQLTSSSHVAWLFSRQEQQGGKWFTFIKEENMESRRGYCELERITKNLE
jgi:hypothetical protein